MKHSCSDTKKKLGTSYRVPDRLAKMKKKISHSFQTPESLSKAKADKIHARSSEKPKELNLMSTVTRKDSKFASNRSRLWAFSITTSEFRLQFLTN